MRGFHCLRACCLGVLAPLALLERTALGQQTEAPPGQVAPPPPSASPPPPASGAPAVPPAPPAAPSAVLPATAASPAPVATTPASSFPVPEVQAPAPSAREEEPAEPFAFGDFTWLNGANRQHKALLDSPIFTGSFLLDINYTSSINHPIDNTVVGSTALSRNDEITLAFMGFGGDFHYGHTRGRLMMQYGLRSTLVPRNDFSTFRGQFDLQDALRYISEGYGGYHWDALNGINLDVGIFMSYVGLFSYDNFENWMYLPSFTSDNTPWFFNGIRLQVFPSDKLKIEPWLINGWQTYGKFNQMPGFGFQVLWRPVDWFMILSNGYAGWDTQDMPGLFRFHSDNSAEVKYYQSNNPFFSKAAFSITADIGGQQGDGLTVFGGQAWDQTDAAHQPGSYSCQIQNADATHRPCNSNFLSWMAYHRMWFFDEKLGFTVGGGMMHNPSRYLVLAPTGNASGVPQNLSIQGVSYVGASNPYDYSFGQNFDAFDYEAGIQYMPTENVTYGLEVNHRQASVPYFAGHGGVTTPDGYITTSTPQGWRADLVTKDDRIIADVLVRF